MNNSELVPAAPRMERGFPVGDPNRVPAIGETGVSQQMFCPLIKGQCMKSMCMFWVELFTQSGEDAQRVGHCAYYWSSLQFVDIKQQLIQLNRRLETITPMPTPREPSA